METKQIYLSLKRGEHLEDALYLYKTAGLKKSDISKKLGIPYSTIKHWIDNFSINNIHSLPDMNSKPNPAAVSNSSGSPRTTESLEAEIARLQKELQRQSLRADVYEEMINVAEAKFKISIRKKAGAKQ